MDGSIFWGGSVVAALVAGSIALFAPCCISVMLPSYFAGSFHNRGVMAAMTFLFAAGVATIILLIAMGASFLRSLIATEHTTIYVGGGNLMLVMGVYLLLGGHLHLPMPGHRAGGTAGPLASTPWGPSPALPHCAARPFSPASSPSPAWPRRSG